MSDRSKSSTLIEPEQTNELEQLLKARAEGSATTPSLPRIDGVLVGRLVAFANDGTVPLVVFEGQQGASAVMARATIDLHGSHIGRDVVLIFENGDPCHPVIIGCLHDADARALPDTPGRWSSTSMGSGLLFPPRSSSCCVVERRASPSRGQER